MARVLLILSIVLTLVAAGLGFVAKQKVDDLNVAIKDRTSKLRTTENNLKKTQDDLTATKKELDTAKTVADEKTAEAEKAKKEADDATAKLADATAKAAALQKKLDEMGGQPGVDPAQAIAEIQTQLTKAQADLAKAQTELAESKQVQETLTQRTKEAEEKAATTERIVRDYKFAITKNGISGKVLAYNPGWNFVVLSIGDKSGLKAGANMVVQRGNTMVAKLKVTTVEPNTAIADVLPGSMRGVRVEPGDTVIFEGTR